MVVRNTFINAVVEEESDDEVVDPLARAMSDPTSGGFQVKKPSGHKIPLPVFFEHPMTAFDENPATETDIDEEPARNVGWGGKAWRPCDPVRIDQSEGEYSGDAPTPVVAYHRSDISTPSMDDAATASGSPRRAGDVQPVALMQLLSWPNYSASDTAPEKCPIVDADSYGDDLLQPWPYWSSYSMFGENPLMFPSPSDQISSTMVNHAGSENSSLFDERMPCPMGIPAIGAGLPLGTLHTFHQEARDMGTVSPDFRRFSKGGYEGRLSVVTESRVHTGGLHRYLVQFSGGELSRADGVGFVFSPRLPCTKNIQRIISIFVNQRGRICLRIFGEIVRVSSCVQPLEIGDWVELAIDLENHIAIFNVWTVNSSSWPNGPPSSTAEFPFGSKFSRLSLAGVKPFKLNVGHLALVVKNVGVTAVLGS